MVQEEKTRTWSKAKNEKSEIVEGIYQHSNGTYYERPNINGVFPFRSLGTKNLKHAREEKSRREFKRAQGIDPQPRPTAITVGEVIENYAKHNYPDRKLGDRPEMGQKSEADKCEMLKRYWDKIIVVDVSAAECDRYRKWRKKQMVRDTSGNRIVDLELNTLSNAFSYATRCELIKSNPIAERPHYVSAKDVTHCRESMPEDTDEVHKIAQKFFTKGGKSEVFGWMVLIEAQTGIRTIEGRQFRVDAKPNEAGWTTKDGESLCIRRAKGQEMVNPFALIHDGLKPTLEAFQKWHDKRYPKSPWYFPSHTYEGQHPVGKDSLAHAMEWVSEEMEKKVTSHGMRGFYITVRRSWGLSDSQIAYEVGQTSGGQTIAKVYGGCPPHWRDGKGPKMSWLPKGEPAWSVLKLS